MATTVIFPKFYVSVADILNSKTTRKISGAAQSENLGKLQESLKNRGCKLTKSFLHHT